jgi:multidrug transporter EmrE-like cation transporter
MSFSAPLLWALACVVASCLAQLAMRHGMVKATELASANQITAIYSSALSQPWVWLGFTLYGASAVVWLWVLSRIPVSTAYPMVSLGFVFAVAGGVWWLGEPFSWLKLGGCLLIVLGVALLCIDWSVATGRPS